MIDSTRFPSWKARFFVVSSYFLASDSGFSGIRMVTNKIGQKMIKKYLKLVVYEPFLDTNYAIPQKLHARQAP